MRKSTDSQIYPPADYSMRLKTTQNRLKTSRQGLADYYGVPVQTLNKWIDGTRTPSSAAAKLIETLEMIETLAPEIHEFMLPKRTTNE